MKKRSYSARPRAALHRPAALSRPTTLVTIDYGSIITIQVNLWTTDAEFEAANPASKWCRPPSL